MQMWGDTVRGRGKSKLQNDRLKSELSGHALSREEEECSQGVFESWAELHILGPNVPKTCP